MMWRRKKETEKLFAEFKKIGLKKSRFEEITLKKFERRKILRLKATGRKAEYIWFRLRRIREKTKYHPIIIRDSLDYWLKDMKGMKTRKILRKAARINPKDFLEKHFNYWYPEDKVEDYEGGWPKEDKPLYGFIIPYERFWKKDKYEPRHRVEIILVPTEQPWKAFAYVPYGHWNDCPSNEGHVAVMKYWFEKYKAEIGAIAADGSIEFFVGNPPLTRDEAHELSIGHFYYCFDRIAQAPHTIQSLASRIVKASSWYFWWD